MEIFRFLCLLKENSKKIQNEKKTKKKLLENELEKIVKMVLFFFVYKLYIKSLCLPNCFEFF